MTMFKSHREAYLAKLSERHAAARDLYMMQAAMGANALPIS